MAKVFNARLMEMPEDLNKLQRLAWKYYFENGWSCFGASDCVVAVQGRYLNNAMIFQDEDCFYDWLSTTAREHLEDRDKDFLNLFIDKTLLNVMSDNEIELMCDMLCE